MLKALKSMRKDDILKSAILKKYFSNLQIISERLWGIVFVNMRLKQTKDKSTKKRENMCCESSWQKGMES